VRARIAHHSSPRPARPVRSRKSGSAAATRSCPQAFRVLLVQPSEHAAESASTVERAIINQLAGFLRIEQDGEAGDGVAKVHPCPASFNEVVDEPEAKLVILGPEHPHTAKKDDSSARAAGAEILNRGSAGRNCGNMLVFLAGDKNRMVDLDQATRFYLAWKSISKDYENETLELTQFQAKQVEQKLKTADDTVKARIPETYFWLLVPGQKRPEQGQAFPPIEWQEIRLQGPEALSERASKKLRNEELLIVSMAGTRLQVEIEQVPLWRGNHVGVKQLVDDFAKYLYLPRVKNAQVILDAIQDGVSRLTWRQDTFAYADYYDATADRYRGLQAGVRPNVELNSRSVVVKPEVAGAQQDKDAAAAAAASAGTGASEATSGGSTAGQGTNSSAGATKPTTAGTEAKKVLRKFHAEVTIDGTRLSRDVDQIAAAVVQHLSGLVGSKVTVCLEIDADIPSGAGDSVVRTVTENCRTLKFENFGFEES
jgi:hypothetical protein